MSSDIVVKASQSLICEGRFLERGEMAISCTKLRIYFFILCCFPVLFLNPAITPSSDFLPHLPPGENRYDKPEKHPQTQVMLKKCPISPVN